MLARALAGGNNNADGVLNMHSLITTCLGSFGGESCVMTSYPGFWITGVFIGVELALAI